MSDLDAQYRQDPLAFHKTWRNALVASAMDSSFMVLTLMGLPWVKFLTEVGATAFDFGLITALGSLSMAFGLVSGAMEERIRSRKLVWAVFESARRLVFIAIVAAPWVFTNTRVEVWWIIAGVGLSHLCSRFAGPLWLSWMADVLPRESLNRHWGRFHSYGKGAQIGVSIAAAFFFDYFERTDQVILGFTILASLGVLVGMGCVFFFSRLPEPEPERSETRPPIREVLFRPIRDPDFLPFLIFMFAWNLAASTAFPFFKLYTVEVLNISVLGAQMLFIMGPIGIALSIPYWGLLCDAYGQKPILQIILVGKILVPLTFFLVPRDPAICIPILLVALGVDGISNGGFFASTQGILLKHTPRRNRAMYVAATNFLSQGIAATIGPLVAGSLIDAFSFWEQPFAFFTLTGFHIAFAISIVLRISTNYFAARLHEPLRYPARTILKHIWRTPVIRVGRAVHRMHSAASDEKRALAANRLGELGSALAIRELVPRLEDRAMTVRIAAANALGRIASSEATQPLAQALMNRESGIGAPAARALGYIGGSDSLRALLQAMQDLDGETLKETIEAVARIGDGSALLPLATLYTNTHDLDIKRRIAWALVRIGEARSEKEVYDYLGPFEERPGEPVMGA